MYGRLFKDAIKLAFLGFPTPTGKNAGQHSLLGRREVQC